MANPRNELVPIRTVSQLTGVNPVTLRAWERRYGLIQPRRTPKGHRLYSQEDIDLIRRVLGMLDRGMSIGQVRLALDAGDAEPEREGDEDNWAVYRSRMIRAVTRFDEAGLDEVYNESLALYPVNLVTRRLILPLLEEIGRRWESGEGTVAEEHFFGCYMRNKLGARFHHRPMRARSARLLMACLPEEYHEIGLLLFALAAGSRGYDIVLLGANMPTSDLPEAVDRAGADAVVLSGSVEPGDQTLDEALPSLVAALDVPVFVGGTGPERVDDRIEASGAISLGSDIDGGLIRLSAALHRLRSRTD